MTSHVKVSFGARLGNVRGIHIIRIMAGAHGQRSKGSGKTDAL